MLRLAVPVVLGELSWMAMGIVDTLMVGRVSPAAIGAVSLGSLIFFTVGIFTLGLLLGLDTMVPQAFGAGRPADCQRALVQGLYLSVLLSPLTILGVLAALPFLAAFGIHPDVVELTIPYTWAIVWGGPPLLLFSALRLYLQGMNLVRPVMVVLISANLLNAIANWLLIFGHLGFPALGVEGAGWASFISRLYLFVALAAYVVWRRHGLDFSFASDRWKWHPATTRRLLSNGWPAAAQRLIEVGAITLITAFIGRLQPASLAAHQIALSAASVTYMVPLGISAAAAVRVGQALGRLDRAAARRAGWTALLLGAVFMSIGAVVFWVAGRWIVRAFTADPEVVQIGVSLLILAAIFQLFDGLQVVATGALRGAGDTRVPMISNLIAHWVLGLPLGYYLCFERGWGAAGMWTGLTLGLVIVGAFLLWVWGKLSEDHLADAGAATANPAP